MMCCEHRVLTPGGRRFTLPMFTATKVGPARSASCALRAPCPVDPSTPTHAQQLTLRHSIPSQPPTASDMCPSRGIDVPVTHARRSVPRSCRHRKANRWPRSPAAPRLRTRAAIAHLAGGHSESSLEVRVGHSGQPSAQLAPERAQGSEELGGTTPVGRVAPPLPQRRGGYKS